jgi:hypothetical protein
MPSYATAGFPGKVMEDSASECTVRVRLLTGVSTSPLSPVGKGPWSAVSADEMAAYTPLLAPITVDWDAAGVTLKVPASLHFTDAPAVPVVAIVFVNEAFGSEGPTLLIDLTIDDNGDPVAPEARTPDAITGILFTGGDTGIFRILPPVD